MCVGDGKVGGGITPEMTFDGHTRLERLLDVLRYVGFDRFEDRWGRVVCDSDLETSA